jgi:hypothetical protein
MRNLPPTDVERLRLLADTARETLDTVLLGNV